MTLDIGGVMSSMTSMLDKVVKLGRLGCCGGSVAVLVLAPTSVCASLSVQGCKKNVVYAYPIVKNILDQDSDPFFDLRCLWSDLDKRHELHV